MPNRREVAEDHATMLADYMDWKSAEAKLQIAEATMYDALAALARSLPR